MMETFGATVHRSPSELTEAGRKYLAENPHHTGSLGIAISEAVEVAAQNPEIRYSLGSVLNHVLLHQTIIGEEALLQLAKAGESAPDVIVGCTGGGSNFAGLSFPFLREKLAGKMSPSIRAVEPASCPSLTRGVYAYDFGDSAGMTPLIKMHTLGHDFVPDPIHAGGLRYHGMSPLMSHVYELGLIEAIAVPQTECFAAGIEFARNEGIVPAPGADARGRRRRARGDPSQGDGGGDRHPHRPVRARPFRPGGVRRLPERPDGRRGRHRRTLGRRVGHHAEGGLSGRDAKPSTADTIIVTLQRIGRLPGHPASRR